MWWPGIVLSLAPGPRRDIHYLASRKLYERPDKVGVKIWDKYSSYPSDNSIVLCGEAEWNFPILLLQCGLCLFQLLHSHR